MVCTVNASTSSSAIVSTADGSGIIKLQSNGVATNALAWVNFAGATGALNGTSYNVSSVTRSGTGIYVVNFTTPTTDANYVNLVSPCGVGSVAGFGGIAPGPTRATGSFAFGIQGQNASSTLNYDPTYVSVAIFGN